MATDWIRYHKVLQLWHSRKLKKDQVKLFRRYVDYRCNNIINQWCVNNIRLTESQARTMAFGLANATGHDDPIAYKIHVKKSVPVIKESLPKVEYWSGY
jgi:hypothetical protein